MTEGKTDWKVEAKLDRSLLVADIMGLVKVLKRQRKPFCVVSADCEMSAKVEAVRRMEVYQRIPPKYVKELRARRLPT